MILSLQGPKESIQRNGLGMRLHHWREVVMILRTVDAILEWHVCVRSTCYQGWSPSVKEDCLQHWRCWKRHTGKPVLLKNRVDVSFMLFTQQQLDARLARGASVIPNY
ncbi:MAG: hypothetical protein AB7D06_17370 [Pedobacter sp.]